MEAKKYLRKLSDISGRIAVIRFRDSRYERREELYRGESIVIQSNLISAIEEAENMKSLDKRIEIRAAQGSYQIAIPEVSVKTSWRKRREYSFDIIEIRKEKEIKDLLDYIGIGRSISVLDMLRKDRVNEEIWDKVDRERVEEELDEYGYTIIAVHKDKPEYMIAVVDELLEEDEIPDYVVYETAIDIIDLFEKEDFEYDLGWSFDIPEIKEYMEKNYPEEEEEKEQEEKQEEENKIEYQELDGIIPEDITEEHEENTINAARANLGKGKAILIFTVASEDEEGKMVGTYTGLEIIDKNDFEYKDLQVNKNVSDYIDRNYGLSVVRTYYAVLEHMEEIEKKNENMSFLFNGIEYGKDVHTVEYWDWDNNKTEINLIKGFGESRTSWFQVFRGQIGTMRYGFYLIDLDDDMWIVNRESLMLAFESAVLDIMNE